MSQKRALVYLNGTIENGKIVKVSDSIYDLLKEVCKRFDSLELNTIYAANGGEIKDTELIRDDEVLYASKGDSFIPVNKINKDSLPSDWVKLNVGGKLFYTSRTTLMNTEANSMLAKMFNPKSNIQPGSTENGAYLIDRNPKYFGPILNYLRSGNLIIDNDINPRGVLEEAHYFGINSIIPLIEPLTINKDDCPLSRKEITNALITTPNNAQLRFQGVNLNFADLSYMDLRNINFKYAHLRKANLSYSNLTFCNFERADLTGANLSHSTLSGVRMTNAIMEGTSCINCNFQDPSGLVANMEGVNLRNAILEDSDLTSCNLRVANLKNSNLKATILRGAILAGADLENCDLTGSDLHEANLRGANLKGAALELMINPLHMAQTIR